MLLKKFLETVKNIIKDNYKTFIVFILIFLVFTVRLPYYISAPGGLMDTKDKVQSEDNFTLSGSLNMAYVSEIHGTIPTLLWALIDKDWDIEKESETVVGNESVEDRNYRNHMLLEESNDIALELAYRYSDIDYEIKNRKVFVTYIDDLAKTDLEVGDQIISVDSKKITEKNDLYTYVFSKNIGDSLTFKVINDDKEYTREATLIDVLDEPKVGAVITETFDIDSNHDVEFTFSKTESGSSGGLMLTLTLYSYLNHIDLTDGKVIVGTGTISADGTVGEISGIKYKLIGAVNKGAEIFLVPEGENYEEARDLKNERGYDIDIVPVETFAEALDYLKGL